MKKMRKMRLKFRKTTAGIILCLCIVAGILTAPVLVSRASHFNPSLFGPGDGALDDQGHVQGIYLALRENYVAAWMMMTEQFVSVMIEQMFIVGTFLDAQQQLEVQRLFQELAAEAHKEFHPSFQMCVFTTNVKSLAQSEHVSWEQTRMLDSIMEKREHLHAALSTAGGLAMDVTHRIKMFKVIYCDADENDQEAVLLCDNSEGPMDRRSKDIDYPRMVDNPYTLDLNYADAYLTDTEKDVLSLARNLYAAPVFDFMPEQLLNETSGQGLYMEARSVHAIRSVARRSFAEIVGMKAEGDPDFPYEVKPFMYGIIHELGVPPDELIDFLGDNPSYFAQMEVLTRKIYHSPDFFTNLYDKPANVKRMGVSLQAIEIMQDRDRYESALRREMLLSLILELKLRQYQEDIHNSMFAAINQKPGRGLGP